MPLVTLGLAHELGLNAALTASILIVLLGGEFPPPFWLAAFAPTVSMALARRDVVVPAISGTLLALLAIGAAVASVLRSGLESAVFAGGLAIVGLLVARTLTRRTLEHDLQALLLSLILVFAGSVLNVGMSYLVVFVAYAISAVWALSTRQLLAGARDAGLSLRVSREREDVITPLFFAASGAVAVAVLAAAILVFVSFPRIGFGELGFLGRKDSQLPPEVGFGSDPRGLSTSTAVVARLRGVPEASFEAGLYLRATTYDVVTTDRFAQSEPDTSTATIDDLRPSLPSLARQQKADVTYEVLLMPMAGPLVFTLGATRTALTLSGGAANPNRNQQIGGRDRHDQLRTFAGLASPLRYRVNGDIAVVGAVPAVSERAPRLDDADRERHLRLPPADPALTRVLDDMLRGAPPATGTDADLDARIALVRSTLLRDFAYTLDATVVGRDEPLKAFLTDVRAGHCELFAGGYALLLRMMGVPSRVVGGFQGGALTDDGSIVFQQRHAHAWVEWWKDGVGWVVDDATPMVMRPRERLTGFDRLVEAMRVLWDDRVVDYALEDQQVAISSVMRKVRGKNLGKILKGTIVAIAVAVPLLLVLQQLRRRRRAASAGNTLAREIVAAAERWSGRQALPSETVREVAERSPHPLLRAATEAFEQTRYGNASLPLARVEALVKDLRALKRPQTPPAG